MDVRTDIAPFHKPCSAYTAGNVKHLHSTAASIQIYFSGAIEAPKTPRGVSENFFFDFGSQNGDFWCILGAIFCSSAKTLRGRKDTLA